MTESNSIQLGDGRAVSPGPSVKGCRASVVVTMGLPAMLLLAVLAGCASQRVAPLQSGFDEAEVCLALFASVDTQIDAADVRDGGAARIERFPWLRSSRFLSSFRQQVAQPQDFEVWIGHLAELDRQARGFELKNLSAKRLARLNEEWRPMAKQHGLPEPLEPALADCRTALNTWLLADSDAQEALRAAAVTPDAYNTWQRVLGLYPLSSRIALWRIRGLHEKLQGKIDSPVRDASSLRYYAAPQADIPTPQEAAALARRVSRDRLGIPRPQPNVEQALFKAHAPVWAIKTASDADRPGDMELVGNERPVVDVEQGVEYRWLSWTRFGGDMLLQLNYALWFPERPPSGWIDIVAGHLDGIIWRTTLDRDGQVLAHDSIHPCGCYYTLFPGEGWQAADVPSDQEPIFAPRDAPARGAGERLVLSLESGTRYFIDVDVGRAPPTRDLVTKPMSRLRSLPRKGDGRASIYQPDGLIPESRRLERFILWPLGVPSAGAMRQPGTHAIAFVGRRHFDDAYLMETVLADDEPNP